MLLGEKIRSARKTKGLTLVQLGELINVSNSALSQIENNKNEVSKKTLIALAKALGDNFGDKTLNEFINASEVVPSKREIAQKMSASELLTLKFGGGISSSSEAKLLAKLLDAEIEKEKRIMSYPERKKK